MAGSGLISDFGFWKILAKYFELLKVHLVFGQFPTAIFTFPFHRLLRSHISLPEPRSLRREPHDRGVVIANQLVRAVWGSSASAGHKGRMAAVGGQTSFQLVVAATKKMGIGSGGEMSFYKETIIHNRNDNGSSIVSLDT